MGTFNFQMPGGGGNLNPTGMPIPPGGTGGGNFNFGNMNPNPNPVGTQPYMPGAGGRVGMAPSATAMTSGVTPNPGGGGTGNPYGLDPRQQQRLQGENQNYYGEGVGSLLTGYLNSSGGYNSALTQQMIDSMTNAMGHQIQLGGNTLESQLGAMGISGHSSGQNVLSDYYSQATQQENSIASQAYEQMWNESQNRELAMLQEVAQVNATGTANQMTPLDYIGDALSIAGSFVHPGGG